jgi:type III pantothenate kinase
VTGCLQFDIGNSSAKWRLVEEGHVTARGHYVASDAGSRRALLDCTGEPSAIWIASVAGESAEAELRSLLATRWNVEPWFARTEAATGDLLNSYADPSRMGVDRWLAMLGAWSRKPGRLCVVDAGSAITIDLVDTGGRHEGGYIVPGPQLMEQALLLDTDRVRFDEDVPYRLDPGVSTAEAVRNGIAIAGTGAVALVIDRLAVESDGLYFSGGAGEMLMGLLDRGGEFVPDLVFEGLEAMAQLRTRA